MLADTPLPHGFGAALASVDTFPRAPEQFVASPLCLVGYVRWDARSDRVPPLQTIIFSSFTGRTKGCRPHVHYAPGESLTRPLCARGTTSIQKPRRTGCFFPCRRSGRMWVREVVLPQQVLAVVISIRSSHNAMNML